VCCHCRLALACLYMETLLLIRCIRCMRTEPQNRGSLPQFNRIVQKNGWAYVNAVWRRPFKVCWWSIRLQISHIRSTRSFTNLNQLTKCTKEFEGDYDCNRQGWQRAGNGPPFLVFNSILACLLWSWRWFRGGLAESRTSWISNRRHGWIILMAACPLSRCL
jgi:hypothetical protein